MFGVPASQCATTISGRVSLCPEAAIAILTMVRAMLNQEDKGSVLPCKPFLNKPFVRNFILVVNSPPFSPSTLLNTLRGGGGVSQSVLPFSSTSFLSTFPSFPPLLDTIKFFLSPSSLHDWVLSCSYHWDTVCFAPPSPPHTILFSKPFPTSSHHQSLFIVSTS